MEATISDLVRQLESDLLDDRQAAAIKLVRLGHAAIPSLRRRSLEASPALQKDLNVVIESIHFTDFLFMVRPEPWNVTATLENADILEAHFELFHGKPLHPPLDVALRHPRSDRAKARSSLTLKNETYWKTVIAFSKAYSVHLDSFAGHGAHFEEGEGRLWSNPHGPCIVSTEIDGSDRPRLKIGLHLEPGFQPIHGGFDKLSIRLSEGVIQEFTELENKSRDRGVLTKDRSIPTVCEFEVPILTKSDFISVYGRARVVLPTKVEGIAWTDNGWRAQPTQVLAGCGVTLKQWENVGLTLGFQPTIRENPDSKRDYVDRAWVFLSDDAGRTSNNRSFGLFGTGYGESGGSTGWPHETPFRRVCVVRPVDYEVIQFEFEIKDIRLSKKRDE